MDDNLLRISRSLMAAAIPSSSSSSSSTSSSIFTNFPLISAFVAFLLAQSIKVVTTWYKERRWDYKQLVASGGMPSSHSATVAALAVGVGFHEGVGSSVFAAAVILACVVMYDATGVRLQAGRQAEVLNQIVYELPAEHPLAESRPLCEILGHTPPQDYMAPWSQMSLWVLLGQLLGVLPMLMHKIGPIWQLAVVAGGLLGLVTAAMIYIVVNIATRITS